MLTEDNLFDGSILTYTENYYIEPAHKYSTRLNARGIHTIVYKASDVQHLPEKNERISPTAADEHYCASERLRKKVKNEFKRRRKYASGDESANIVSDNRRNSFNKLKINDGKHRSKRWLPDEVSRFGTKFVHFHSKSLHFHLTHAIRVSNFSPCQLSESKDPPLPLDLDVPYNEDFSIYSRTNNKHNQSNRKPDDSRKNILINGYNPSSNDFILRNSTQFGSNTILSNSFDNTSGNHQNGKYVINTNSSRPSHKTHVEIITKNGATKKPNVIGTIGNNYKPDVILTRTNFHHHHHHHMSSFDNLNGEGAAKSVYDRKSTCMLYLQADHTFFQKMGSEEASIEAITRHVQRANSIYKNTGKRKRTLRIKSTSSEKEREIEEKWEN